ncbi:DUF1259 domain-containing protein [Brevibacillus ginsengisoli]|uniref:DUF1259 domain-containing protein n=1 Tax=Brevibacillus ginsengisoli TaxID=363854 RepID=UPI003CED5B00
MAKDPLCKQFGDILGIPPQVINGVCTLMTVRNIPVTIFGRHSRSALTTALHNHWLFNNPGIMYIHFESIDDPIQFAQKVRHAISVLKH